MKSPWQLTISVIIRQQIKERSIDCAILYCQCYNRLMYFAGPFLLTNLLLDYMIYTSNIMGEGRIVNVTCGLHDHENHWITKS